MWNLSIRTSIQGSQLWRWGSSLGTLSTRHFIFLKLPSLGNMEQIPAPLKSMTTVSIDFSRSKCSPTVAVSHYRHINLKYVWLADYNSTSLLCQTDCFFSTRAYAASKIVFRLWHFKILTLLAMPVKHYIQKLPAKTT